MQNINRLSPAGHTSNTYSKKLSFQVINALMAKTLTNITFLGRAQQVRNQTRIKGQTDMKVIKRE